MLLTGWWANRRLGRRRRRVAALLEQLAFEGQVAGPDAVIAAAAAAYTSAKNDDGSFDHTRLAELFGGGPTRNICFDRPSAFAYTTSSVITTERRAPRFTPVDVASSGVDDDLQITIRVDAFLEARLEWHQSGRAQTDRARGRLISYWTFVPAPRNGDLTLSEVEPSYAGSYHERRSPSLEAIEPLRDAAFVETGWADRGFRSSIPLEIARELPDDPVEALMDIAQIDGRFAPHVVEASVGHLVRAWTRASNKRSAGLDRLASPRASRQLLDKGWAIRAARVDRVKCLRVRPMRVPPQITVEVELWAWYGPRQAAEMVHSLDVPPHERTLYWRLALDGPRRCPWRLVDARADPFSP